jgi:hypothetical protein
MIVIERFTTQQLVEATRQVAIADTS